jgi:hypothetical protein
VSAVEEIETALAQLPKDQFWKLTERLIALREDEWDFQIEADAKSGKLDKLFEQADRPASTQKTS